MKREKEVESGQVIDRSRRAWIVNIYKDFILDKNLSYEARFVWMLIKSYASPGRPCPWPGSDTLAKHMGVMRSSFRKYRKELLDKRYLAMRPRAVGRSYNYVLFDEPYPEGADPFEGLELDNPDTYEGGWSKRDHGQNTAPGGWSKRDQGGGQNVTRRGGQDLTTKNSHIEDNNNKSSQAASPRVVVAGKKGKGTVADATGESKPGKPGLEQASGVDADTGNSLDENLRMLVLDLMSISKACFKKTWAVTPQFSVKAREFFEDNPGWIPNDIILVIVKGYVKSLENSAPAAPKTFDPFFYSRQFADNPRKYFDMNNAGGVIMHLMAKEIDYTPSSNDYINEELNRCYRRLKEIRSGK